MPKILSLSNIPTDYRQQATLSMRATKKGSIEYLFTTQGSSYSFSSLDKLHSYLSKQRNIDTWEIQDLSNQTTIYKHTTLGEIETFDSERELNRVLSKETDGAWKVIFVKDVTPSHSLVIQSEAKDLLNIVDTPQDHYVIDQFGWFSAEYKKYYLDQADEFLVAVGEMEGWQEQQLAWLQWGMQLLLMRNQKSYDYNFESRYLFFWFTFISMLMLPRTCFAQIENPTLPMPASTPKTFKPTPTPITLGPIQSTMTQEPDTFAKILWPGSDAGNGRAIQKTSDKGFVVTGEYNQSMFLSKWFENGTLAWSSILEKLPNTGIISGFSVQQTDDAGFLVAGNYDFSVPGIPRPGYSGSLLLSKWYEDGVLAWTSFVDDSGRYNSVQRTRDKGFIAVGYKHLDIFLSKWFETGIVHWAKIIEWGGVVDQANAVVQTRDDGFVVVGQFNNNAFISKWSASGAFSWAKTLKSNGSVGGTFNAVQQTLDGSFLAVGSSFIGSSFSRTKILFSKWSEIGELSWSSVLNLGFSATINSIQKISDGSLVGVGNADDDAFISRWFDNGTLIWAKKIIWGQQPNPPRNNTGGISLVQMDDGGFVITGTITNASVYSPPVVTNILIAKLNSSGAIENCYGGLQNNVTEITKLDVSFVNENWDLNNLDLIKSFNNQMNNTVVNYLENGKVLIQNSGCSPWFQDNASSRRFSLTLSSATSTPALAPTTTLTAVTSATPIVTSMTSPSVQTVSKTTLDRTTTSTTTSSQEIPTMNSEITTTATTTLTGTSNTTFLINVSPTNSNSTTTIGITSASTNSTTTTVENSNATMPTNIPDTPSPQPPNLGLILGLSLGLGLPGAYIVLNVLSLIIWWGWKHKDRKKSKDPESNTPQHPLAPITNQNNNNTSVQPHVIDPPGEDNKSSAKESSTEADSESEEEIKGPSIFISYAKVTNKSPRYEHDNNDYVNLIKSDLKKAGITVHQDFNKIESAKFLLLIITKAYLQEWKAYKKSKNRSKRKIFNYIDQNHNTLWPGNIILMILEDNIQEDNIETDLPFFASLNKESNLTISNFEVTSDRHSKYAIAKLHASQIVVNSNEQQAHTLFKSFLKNTVTPFCRDVAKNDQAKIATSDDQPSQGSRTRDIKLEPKNNYFYAMFRLIRNLYGINLKHEKLQEFRQLRQEFFKELRKRQQSTDPDDGYNIPSNPTSTTTAFSGNPTFNAPVTLTVAGAIIGTPSSMLNPSASQSTNSGTQKTQLAQELPKAHQPNQGENVMPKIYEDKRPSDYVYAVLSQHVYEGKALNEGALVEILEDEWEIIKAQDVGQFFGVVYQNIKTNHIVVAYRGTQGPFALRDWIENMRGIVNHDELSPYKEATFNLAKYAFELARRKKCSLSFTGHSLGAYLAELSVGYCHSYYETNQPVSQSSASTTNTAAAFDVCESVHAVTFESPGTKNILEKLQPKVYAGQVKLTQLDITTYLSYPNIVNTCNEHVGTVYGIEPKISNWSNIAGLHIKEVHSMENIVKLFEQASDKCPGRFFMLDWPTGNQTSVYFANKKLQDNQYTWTKALEELSQDFKFVMGSHFRIDHRLSDWKMIPLLHFNRPMQRWLESFYPIMIKCSQNNVFLEQAKAEWKKSGIPDHVIGYLLSCVLVKEDMKGTAYLSIESENVEQTGFFIRKQLSRWLSENSDKADKILETIQTLQKRLDIEVAFAGPGGRMTGGAINKAKLQGVLVDIPPDTDPQMVKYFEQVSKHFLDTLKASGVTLGVYLVAGGGVLENVTVTEPELTGVKFQVGAKPQERIINLSAPAADAKQTTSQARLAADQFAQLNQSAPSSSTSSAATSSSATAAAINKPRTGESLLPSHSF